MGVGGQRHAPAALPPGMTHFTGGWVDLKMRYCAHKSHQTMYLQLTAK
jgi:hypothetical protein